MTNVKLDVKDKVLTITVNLAESHGRSKSGKTTIIGSTEGPKKVEGREDIVVLTVYRK